MKIVSDPDIRQKLAAVGFDAVGSTPAEFDAKVKAEIAKWAKVIAAAGIKPQ